MDTVPVWSRDRFEVKRFLLDHNFKQAAQAIDGMTPGVADQIISAAFSVQNYRNTSRAQRRPILFTQLRAEQNMTRAELAEAVRLFQGADVLQRDRDWKGELDKYCAGQIGATQYAYLKKIRAPFPEYVVYGFERTNPRPSGVKVEATDITAIEDNRPGREVLHPHFVQLFERFFSNLAGVKLTWEALLSEMTAGEKDPRTVEKNRVAARNRYQKKGEAQGESVQPIPSIPEQVQLDPTLDRAMEA